VSAFRGLVMDLDLDLGCGGSWMGGQEDGRRLALHLVGYLYSGSQDGVQKRLRVRDRFGLVFPV
jgi:hypothetical protein